MFKRSTTTYGQTPQPETPYQKAAQVWDERIGSARVQARNWRLMAFGCLALSLGLSGGVIWQAGQEPHRSLTWLKWNPTGAMPGPSVRQSRPIKPSDAQIAYPSRADFIETGSGPALSLDPVVLRKNWLACL